MKSRPRKEVTKEASTTDKTKLECFPRLPNIETKISYIWNLFQIGKHEEAD